MAVRRVLLGEKTKAAEGRMVCVAFSMFALVSPEVLRRTWLFWRCSEACRYSVRAFAVSFVPYRFFPVIWVVGLMMNGTS